MWFLFSGVSLENYCSHCSVRCQCFNFSYAICLPILFLYFDLHLLWFYYYTKYCNDCFLFVTNVVIKDFLLFTEVNVYFWNLITHLCIVGSWFHSISKYIIFQCPDVYHDDEQRQCLCRAATKNAASQYCLKRCLRPSSVDYCLNLMFNFCYKILWNCLLINCLVFVSYL